MNPKLTSLLVTLSLTTAAPALAETIFDVSKLKDAMEDAVVKREMASAPVKLKGGEANILDFKITGVRVNGQKPELKSYWVQEQLVPVFVCPTGQKKTYTETRSIVARSEVTLSQTIGLKAHVEVSVTGSAGAVEGTVAAGIEASVEKGVTKTTGTEVTAVTGQTWDILPGTGEWVGGVGERYKYDDAEYEVDIEVKKAMFRTPMMPLGWMPKEYGGKKPLKLTAKGKFSASILEGGVEVNSTPMSQAELDDHCKTTAGRPTNLGIKAVSLAEPIDGALQRKKR